MHPCLGGLSLAHPFGDSLAEVLHPVRHVFLILGTQLQGGPVCQDHLEGVGPVGGVGAPASPTLLAAGREGGGWRSAGQTGQH